jgi:hypothetical protein
MTIRRAVLLLLITATPPVDAATLRYAAVIGVDVGVDPASGPLPSLMHAEREATRLHAKLLECCNFDADADRTLLLLRPTRTGLREAIRRLRFQMHEDRRLYGEIETMFALFFTGHGLDGRVLLADGALSKDELGGIFREIDADLTLGVFDACYSASLDPGSLKAKGLRPTPGVNVLRELPEEVLGAEGSVWFVSSGPEEESYEDRELGGVFTHYLIEALERAEPDGPGIPLDSIWNYVQSKTKAHTAARARPQHPQRIISKMRERSSIYFSFPSPRDAVLALGRQVHGTFFLTYAGGQLSERIDKKAGAPIELDVYSGSANLTWLEGGKVQAQQELELASGSKVILSGIDDLAPEKTLGQNVEGLWVKGFGAQTVRADRIEPKSSLLVGAAYSIAFSGHGRLLPQHGVAGLVRLDRQLLVLEARLGYGFISDRFPTWAYDAHALTAELRGGIGLDILAGRFSLLLALGGGPLFQKYQDDTSRTVWFAAPKVVAGMTWTIFDPIAVRLDAEGGLLVSPGAGVEAKTGSSPLVGASVSVMGVPF